MGNNEKCVHTIAPGQEGWQAGAQRQTGGVVDLFLFDHNKKSPSLPEGDSCILI